ncbi:hypothetical protein BJ138DRAFT_895405 [Hygrophoropsis aurantiaca]|uniref:Uncharacterized protein n=1 Tax=Hygrophoropsis aurantiaca TaxID=72124 RepID=A0ACB8AE86_9AGAM|nr:hypothetical protein BJ138DRAFT_895405 [Hygrophoropsis aurantiaca]
MASGGEPPRSPSLSSTRNLLPAGSSKPPSPVLANHETRRPRFDSMASEGEPPKSPLDSILNLPATSEPCDPASEYVRGQAATADAEPHEEETRPSEPETPVTPASQNIWDFEEDCESERGSSDRRPSCDPPASSGSLVLPPSHSTLSVHVLPSINNSTVHLTNDVKDNITEQPTIASSPPDPDPATKTPETLDPGPTQTNISISSRFWFRILRLMGRHNTTQQQSNTKRSSNIEMHTVAPGRPKVVCAHGAHFIII